MNPLPLTIAQRRLWLERRVDPSRATDRITATWDLAAPFDESRVAEAMAWVARRHDALSVTLDPHEPVQHFGESRLQWTVDGARLTITVPPECCDAPSMAIVRDEISAILEGRAAFDDAGPSYVDAVLAERDRNSTEPEAGLSPRVSGRPSRIEPELDGEDLDAVAVETRPLTFCASDEAHVAAFMTLIARHTGSEVQAGIYAAPMGHAAVGCFENLIPLTTLEQARRHAAIPFDRMLEILRPERAPHQHPLFEITFALGEHVVPTRARFDLELTAGDGLQLVYRSAFWPRAWAREFLRQYEQHLRGCSITPSTLETAPAELCHAVADPGAHRITPSGAQALLTRTLKTQPSDARWMIFSGEPLTDGLVQRWRRLFPGPRILNLHDDACVYEVPEEPVRGVQPIGRPLPGVDVRVVAGAGRECATGELGELMVRGRRTGEVARIRSDGAIQLMGRNDRIATISGAPAAVERDTASHRNVARVTAGFVAPRDPVELHLARLWEELLKVDAVGARDDFFELGGDSLLAVQMLARVEQDLDVSLAPSALLPDATIERLADRVRSGERSEGALVSIQRGTREPALFCVHPSGGSILCYVDLARLMGRTRQVFGLKGPDPRSADPPPQDAAAMAARYVTAIRALRPRGPYFLAGYSFGGLIAFEMARQLEGEVEMLALLDTRYPRAYGPADRNPVVDLGEVLERHDLDRDAAGEREEHELWSDLMELAARYLPSNGSRRRGFSMVQEFCRTYRLMPAAGDLGYDDLRRFLRNLRSNFRTMRDASPAPLDVRCVLFAATRTLDGGPSDHEGNAALWRTLTPSLEVRTVEAHHFNLLAPPSVAAIARELTELLP